MRDAKQAPILCFADSNIWLYTLLDEQDAQKANLAKLVIQQNNIVISTQVINEICVNLIRKAKFDEAKIQALIESLYNRYPVVPINREALLKASELRQRYQFSFWDSLIVACTLAADATILYSEDMDTSLTVEGRLRIANPLVH